MNSGFKLVINEEFGNIWTWGNNVSGQLGDNSITRKSSPVQTVAGGSKWKQIGDFGSGNSNFGIKTDGTLWGWGDNSSGQLGDNTVTSKSSPVQTIAGGANWKSVSASAYHTGAIKTDGTLWMWGYNNSGSLGDNTIASKSSPVQTVAGGTNWKQVSISGGGHTAAIKTDGTLWMWGYNAYGQLGDNTTPPKSSPVQTVAGGTDWKSVSVGYFHTAAIKTDGTLWMWGKNSYGKLGDNTDTHKSSPVQTVAGGTNWKEVSAGYDHIAAIKTDGTLWLWGRNNQAQLGDNTTINKSSPVQTIAGGTNWKSVALGGYHTVAIKTDGTLWTWGDNVRGQLGDNSILDRSSPVQTVAGGMNWSAVSCGYFSTIALETYTNKKTAVDTTLWAWGFNLYGQLGDNSTINKLSPVQTVSTGTNWKQIGGGYTHTAAIKTDGTLWMFGRNNQGQLGDNTIVDKSSPVQTVAGGTNWKEVSSGDSFTSAIKTDGTLWVWGYNNQGQLGDNTVTKKSSPVQTIAGGTNWKQVACSQFHTAAIKTDGTLWSWGYNNYGQLGDNTVTRKSSPVQTVAGGTNWKQVSAGGKYQTTAIKNDGTLWLWGSNYDGQLGDNTNIDRSSPVQTVAGGTDWKSISSGKYTTTAIKNDGTLWAWGNNGNGQIGDNTQVKKSSPVQTVAGGTNWKQVSCGYYITSAIKTDGTLWTWGYNSNGTIGDETIITRLSPVQTVAGGTDWSDVSVFGGHTVALRTNIYTKGSPTEKNNLLGVGANFFGQLGDSTTVDRLSLVQTVAGGTNWKQLSAGYGHVSAIKTDGTLWLYGYNGFGQLGDNTTTNKSSPVQTVAGGTNWKQVACGGGHTAAIKTNGTLWLWGDNSYGLLGDGTNGNMKSSPVQTVAGGTNWKQVSASSYHTAAIKDDGTLWLWGSNYAGHLGDNTIVDKSSPVQTVAGGTNWKQVACVATHTAAIKTDGTLWTWGANYDAQLGDNTLSNRSSPVQTVAGGTNWKQIADMGGEPRITAAIKTDGTLWSWGYNAVYGQLNDGTLISKSSPVQTVAGGTNWYQIACTKYATHAIKSELLAPTPPISDMDDYYVRKDYFLEGGLWAWGQNGNGQLGDNTSNRKSSPVQTVAGGTNWKQVSVGTDHSAAIKTDGTLWLWGYNINGQLGDNTVTDKSSPVQTVAGGTNWKEASSSDRNTMAIKTDGTLWTWGSNGDGQLGDNTITQKSSPVQTVAGGSNWKQVSASKRYSMAIKTDGTLWAWGYNYNGQLGDNSVTKKSSPVQTVAGGTNWKQVSAGGYGTAAAIKTDGTLWAWGYNNYGQIGDNTTIRKSSPVQTVAGGTNWKQVSAGGYFMSAIKTDGTLWAWGYNYFGQIGDNTTIRKSSPVQTVAGGTNWKQLSCGYQHITAIKTDSTLWTWGYNSDGQIGDNTLTKRSSPVQTVAGGTNWKQVSAGGYYTSAITF